MQRESNIAWRKSQQNKLTNAVRKANAKITREVKKNPLLKDYVPPKLNAKQLKTEIKTAKDLNALVSSVNRMFKPNAFDPVITEQGIKTTKYEIKDLSLKVKRINKFREQEKKDANVSTKKGTMGTIRSNELRPKVFNPNKLTKQEWENYKRQTGKQSSYSNYGDKVELYKENYIKAVYKQLGNIGQPLADYVETLDPEFMYNMYYEDPVLAIDFPYDPQEAEFIVDLALEKWEYHKTIWESKQNK